MKVYNGNSPIFGFTIYLGTVSMNAACSNICFTLIKLENRPNTLLLLHFAV